MIRLTILLALLCLVNPVGSNSSPQGKATNKSQTQADRSEGEASPPPLVFQNQTDAAYPGRDASCKQHGNRQGWKWGLTEAEFVMALLTGIYVCLTGVYVFVSWRTFGILKRQALSMRRQTTQMRKAAIYARRSAREAKRSADNDEQAVRLTQRADVLLRDFEIRQDGADNPIGRNTQFILNIENFGPTRANDVKFDFGISAAEQAPTETSQHIVTPVIPIAMGAHDVRPYTFAPLSHMFKGEVINAIRDGAVTVRISGTISYSDVFGKRYRVTCGGEYSPKLTTIVAYETKIEESE